ncbi:MAG: hypothetical protein VZR27_01755 [Acutalibacteraceae bacterium]|nr:hypothetical protein [Clostridia bacterium]MEE3449415.1 hypothetical protein [Acutalibacteraceae bacterium]
MNINYDVHLVKYSGDKYYWYSGEDVDGGFVRIYSDVNDFSVRFSLIDTQVPLCEKAVVEQLADYLTDIKQCY